MGGTRLERQDGTRTHRSGKFSCRLLDSDVASTGLKSGGLGLEHELNHQLHWI